MTAVTAVSYTHLDVYKRQVLAQSVNHVTLDTSPLPYEKWVG